MALPPYFREGLGIGIPGTDYLLPKERGSASQFLASNGTDQTEWKNMSSKQVYGESIVAKIGEGVLNEDGIRKLGSYNNADIVRNFDSVYSQCFVDLYQTNLDGESILWQEEGLQFNSLVDIGKYIDINAVHDSGLAQSVVMKVYDKIDLSIRKPAKIFGFNSLFSRLKGKETSYYGKIKHVGSDIAWSEANNTLDFVWEAVYAESHIHKGNFTQNDRNTFWFSGSYRNRYSLGLGGVDIPGGSDRMAISPANDLIDPSSLFHMDPKSKIVIFGVDPTGGGLDFYGKNGIRKNTYRGTAWALLNGHSLMMAFGLVDSDGNRAILLKPGTIDSFSLPYYEQPRYRLEAIGNNKERGTKKLAILPVKSSSPNYNVMGPYNLADIRCALTSSGGSSMSYSSKEPNVGSVRFQVRDLTTNLVSAPSDAEIILKERESLFNLRAFVKGTVLK